MISLKRLPFFRNYTSTQWEYWWRNRKINWQEAYLSTWSHPHRQMIVSLLKRFPWFSLLEVGSGPGANLAAIVHAIPGRQVGGVDINPEAIQLGQKTFHGAFFKVCPAHDIMMSDNSCDVILTDMTLIYYGPRRVHEVIKEIRRVARTHVVLCEFHSENWFSRLSLRLRTGYHAHNYRKLLTKYGFYDIMIIKVPPEAWPGSDAQQRFRYILLAKVQKRKL